MYKISYGKYKKKSLKNIIYPKAIHFIIINDHINAIKKIINIISSNK